MAINDIYTTHKCRNCGSKVEEIPLCDNWGEHVMSAFECTKCGMKVSECEDLDIDDYVETTYHR